jgi:hypothetical protein
MHKLSLEDLGVIRAGPTLKLPLPDTHCWDEDENIDVWSYSHEAMLKYANQVAKIEREQCAKICEEMHANGSRKYTHAEECAEAIRRFLK